MADAKESIDEILQLRESHRDRAARRRSHREAEVLQARKRVARDEKTLEEFTLSLPERERALFDEIKTQKVKLGDIDAMRHKVALLHEEKQKLAKELEKGKEQLEEAKKALAEAAEKLRLALRNVEKIKEAERILESRRLLAAERTAEKETEELYAVAPNRRT